MIEPCGEANFSALFWFQNWKKILSYIKKSLAWSNFLYLLVNESTNSNNEESKYHSSFPWGTCPFHMASTLSLSLFMGPIINLWLKKLEEYYYYLILSCLLCLHIYLYIYNNCKEPDVPMWWPHLIYDKEWGLVGTYNTMIVTKHIR